MTNPLEATRRLDREDAASSVSGIAGPYISEALPDSVLLARTRAQINNRPWIPPDRPLTEAIQSAIEDGEDFHEAHGIVERKRARLGADMAHPSRGDSEAIQKIKEILAGMKAEKA